jgi:hypothetical protein
MPCRSANSPEPSAGFEPAQARDRNPALCPLSYEGSCRKPSSAKASEGILLRGSRSCEARSAKQDGWGGRDRTCSLRSQNPPRRQLRHSPMSNGAQYAPLQELRSEIIVPLAAVETAGTQAAFLETAVPTRMGTGRCARVSRSAPCRRAPRGRRVAPVFPKHIPRLRLREVSKGWPFVEVVASHGRLLLFELGQNGQGGRIRTCDLLVPGQERCQAALRPESGPSSRTRTCDLPVRNRALSSTELWMDNGAASGIRTRVDPVESRGSWPARRSPHIGSRGRIRTHIERLTTARPAVGRLGNGGTPR